MVQGIVSGLEHQYRAISVYKQAQPDALLWSMSRIADGCVLVRVAGKETEIVKNWLKTTLSPLAELIGIDVYSRAFV